ncbi:MAG TPA: DUF2752 domain-containing protein [Bryobacteraceae bacterium]|nr:DUF2752 domain-containing protein [Bryobacteraceae bacterium]
MSIERTRTRPAAYIRRGRDPMNQVRSALVAVWLIVSAATAVVASSPFWVEHSFLFSAIPACPEKARGLSCAACGMTTGFVAIADGSWNEAHRANAGAIPLFFGIVTNAGLALAYGVRHLKPKEIKWDS